MPPTQQQPHHQHHPGQLAHHRTSAPRTPSPSPDNDNSNNGTHAITSSLGTDSGNSSSRTSPRGLRVRDKEKDSSGGFGITFVRNNNYHYDEEMSGMRLSGSKPGPSRRYPVSFALGGAQFSIPRPLVRGLILLVALGALYFIAGAGGKVDDTWSATSESERGRARESEGWSRFDGLSRLFGGGSGQRVPSSQAPIGRDKNGQIKLSPRPNTYRLDKPLPSNRTNPYHPGHSRVVIPNTNPVEYELRPLPSIEEAFAHLRPRLYDLKEKFPEIPREHDLNNPIHPPFLTPELMERYAHLGGEWDDKKKKWIEGGEKRYLFTTVCRQVTGMLADWFATWTVVVDFLGPESCVFALMEGPSDDGAGEIIAAAMKEHLLFLGVPPENLFIQTHMPSIDWENSHRIQTLADLRNAVMQPIYDSKYPGKSPDNKEWSAVLFYNDVYFGGRHFLEILHQHFFQDADMTCGWDHAGKWFYDGWVGRDMSGDLYTPFPVPKDQQEDPQRVSNREQLSKFVEPSRH